MMKKVSISQKSWSRRRNHQASIELTRATSNTEVSPENEITEECTENSQEMISSDEQRKGKGRLKVGLLKALHLKWRRSTRKKSRDGKSQKPEPHPSCSQIGPTAPSEDSDLEKSYLAKKVSLSADSKVKENVPFQAVSSETNGVEPHSSELGHKSEVTDVCKTGNSRTNWANKGNGSINENAVYDNKCVLTVHEENKNEFPKTQCKSNIACVRKPNRYPEPENSATNNDQKLQYDMMEAAGACAMNGARSVGEPTNDLSSSSSLSCKIRSLPNSTVPSPNRSNTYLALYESPKVVSLTRELYKLSKCGWYWGPITKGEAEEKLSEQTDGAFLVRDSSSDRYLLSLSFRSLGKNLHSRIEHRNGLFSFYEQPETEKHSSIVQLIEQAVHFSKSGVFCHSRSRCSGEVSYPVRLTKPISRFTQVRSLQYLTRFVIRQYTRFDHIQRLPLPPRIKGYLEEGHY